MDTFSIPLRDNANNLSISVCVSSSGFGKGEIISYINIGVPLLRSYTRRYHKGAYQNNTLNLHQKNICYTSHLKKYIYINKNECVCLSVCFHKISDKNLKRRLIRHCLGLWLGEWCLTIKIILTPSYMGWSFKVRNESNF